jgi:hypothetical protein
MQKEIVMPEIILAIIVGFFVLLSQSSGIEPFTDITAVPTPDSVTEEAPMIATPPTEGKSDTKLGSADTPAREPENQNPTGRYTTATEVKPILGMTRPSWIAIQQNGDQDYLYFTNLLAWRCGLWEVRYGLNGAPPETVLPLEPCYDDTASPNGMVDIENYPIYLTAPGGSLESVEIELLFDDGTTDAAVYARQSVLMPG